MRRHTPSEAGLSEPPQSHRLYYIEKQIVVFIYRVDDICCSGSCWPFHSVALHLYFKATAESIDAAQGQNTLFFFLFQVWNFRVFKKNKFHETAQYRRITVYIFFLSFFMSTTVLKFGSLTRFTIGPG